MVRARKEGEGHEIGTYFPSALYSLVSPSHLDPFAVWKSIGGHSLQMEDSDVVCVYIYE